MALKSLLNGQKAEQLAAKYLRKQGVRILDRNKRYACGELDIVASDGISHIFVEVKYRTSTEFGSASEMVSKGKQMKLVRAAKLWLQENDPSETKACRFDVIAINDSKSLDGIEWIKNAFTPELW